MKQLRRSRKDTMIAGVAGGLAKYADIDVTLVRLIWVLLFFAGGIGFFLYLICWVIFPEDTGENQDLSAAYAAEAGNEQDAPTQQSSGRRNLGLILIGLGLFFLVKNIVPWYVWEKAWPLLLVILGLYILFSNRKGDRL